MEGKVSESETWNLIVWSVMYYVQFVA